MKSWKIILSGIASSLSVALITFPSETAFAQWRGYDNWGMGPGGMMGGWSGMGWFGGIFMMVFWALIIVGLIFLVKWLIQSTTRDRERIEPGSRALDILKERYARGEIDSEEFEQKKRDLRAS